MLDLLLLKLWVQLTSTLKFSYTMKASTIKLLTLSVLKNLIQTLKFQKSLNALGLIT